MNKPGRLLSLDAFRGLTMAGMTIVNNPGDWGNVYAPLLHAESHGVYGSQKIARRLAQHVDGVPSAAMAAGKADMPSIAPIAAASILLVFIS